LNKKKLSQYQKRHIEYVHNKVAKAIIDNGLIDIDEKVLVAVSGGKDSLVLLETLAILRQYDFLNFTLEAIHIDVEDVPYSTDIVSINSICKRLGVEMKVLVIESDIENRGKKSPCFVCSWHRRKALFTYANENGFKKLALGHHMDDAVETLLINMAYHGNISSLPAKLSMFEGAISLIRPLILVTNKDTQEYANIKKYPKQTVACPFEDITKRTTVRNIINQLVAINPKASQNLFRSMGNIDLDYLP